MHPRHGLACVRSSWEPFQDFFCDERRMASLISLIERSISASSSSSGTSWPITLAWMVEANTSSPRVCVEMPVAASLSSALSHSMASTETLSLFGPPLRSACSTSSGTASGIGYLASCSVMTGNDRLVQEAQRVGERGLGVALEQRRERLQRELRGDLALGVAAHAVGKREEARIPRVAIAHAVFVLFAAALAAHLVDRESHALALVRFSSCSFSRSLKLNLV